MTCSLHKCTAQLSRTLTCRQRVHNKEWWTNDSISIDDVILPIRT